MNREVWLFLLFFKTPYLNTGWGAVSRHMARLRPYIDGVVLLV